MKTRDKCLVGLLVLAVLVYLASEIVKRRAAARNRITPERAERLLALRANTYHDEEGRITEVCYEACGSSPVTDISLLASLPDLELVDLLHVSTHVDLSHLVSLKNLRTLALPAGTTKGLSPLAEMPNLEKLIWGKCFLPSHSSGWPPPEFNEAPLADLAKARGLKDLRIVGGQMSDVEALTHLPELQSLALISCRIQDLSHLTDLSNLRCLNLQNTPITNLSLISSLHELRELRIDGSPVSDLSPLSGLHELRTLSLDETPVSDLSSLSSLRELSRLLLEGTAVSDLGPIGRLEKLTYVDLSDTDPSNLKPLERLTHLEKLDLRQARFEDTEVEHLQEALPNCEIVY